MLQQDCVRLALMRRSITWENRSAWNNGDASKFPSSAGGQLRLHRQTYHVLKNEDDCHVVYTVHHASCEAKH